MQNVLERLKKKELEIKGKRAKSIFSKIESNNSKTLYHTKIMMDFFTFGVDKRQKYKFFIAFRGLFNQSKVELFSLFALKDDDKFLGIYYGYRKPIQNLVTRYEENGVTKSSTFSKVYYVEFRFKKGSVFCYIKGIAYLLKKEKIDTKYYKSLLEKLINLEKQVYEFYNEKLSDGSFINKWIIKRQK